MTSESARMSSAAEARFRIQAPNSTPRVSTVIALDAPSVAVVERLAAGGGLRASFLNASSPDAGDPAEPGWLADLHGRPRRLEDEVNATDLVIMIAAAGGHAPAAAAIGRACSLKRVSTTALIIGTAAASEEELSRTLSQLRPWSLMVVIAGNDSYIEDMMTALRVS